MTVLNGSPAGLLPFDGYTIVEGDSGLPDIPENGDELGAALATGDWNGDFAADLAIGVPGEDNVGAVLVLFGSDFPNIPYPLSHAVRGIGALPLSRAAKRRILWDNAVALFGLRAP